MQGELKRNKTQLIKEHLGAFKAVALLGARQVGKSTLAKHIISTQKNSLYLDLEDPRDFAKLQDPLAFLEANHQALICIDEVQRYPELFKVLRGYLDKNKRAGQLLLLGSASRDLIRQSSESLAGRISYIEIGPFNGLEVENHKKLWIQGGYPESYKLNENLSFDWRSNYIRTFLERDIPQLGFNIPAAALGQFWSMLAHMNGTILNQSKLATSMGVSVPTIKNYLDILEGTFVIKRLPAYHSNSKKRLIKSPKIYIRDSGLVHALLRIENYNELLGHPAIGASFETFVISSVLEKFPHHEAFYYRSAGGAEIDLVLVKAKEKIAIEIKCSSAPVLSSGFHEAIKFVKPQKSYVIAQVDKPYPIHKDTWVHNLSTFLNLEEP